HNPTAADGAEGLRAFIDFLKARYPNQRGEIKRVIAEGDLVVLHVHSTRGDGTPGRAIVDIFRIENGKVMEHWDVIQDIPAQSATMNGMFGERANRRSSRLDERRPMKDRRTFLKSLAAAGTALVARPGTLFGQPRVTRLDVPGGAIDVHHHFVPP